MKLYNTLTRKIEEFRPIDPDHVKIYTCGPTVYDYAHIGNLTSYIYWDLLIRTLKANQFTPFRVLNLTDVGHLVTDSDEGEDKLEKGAKREKKTVWEIAEYYSDVFLKDFRSLNLTEPSKICRATDYINQNIELIKKLLEKGYAYQISDGIYYDTAKFDKYPDFARLKLEELKAGARVNFNPEKRSVSDFALWKFIQPGEDHAMRWDFLGRDGYPGWHIECSAIIHAELGETIDIHTGGIDHIPVHHTNEIAQSEAAYGKKFCNFWLHCKFINIDHQKISKSLGNAITLQDLKNQGFSPLDFKMWVLQGHYQSDRNFTLVDLESAKTRRLSWKNKIAELIQSPESGTDNIVDQIINTVSNNLNSAEAFALIDGHSPDLDSWKAIDQIFGLNLLNEVVDITPEQKDLIIKRESARRKKDFKTSDQIRDLLSSQNLTIKDRPNGPIWQYLK